ncbi:MAG: hypothetical protein V2A79_19275 [Planctomycetota bacterium]
MGLTYFPNGIDIGDLYIDGVAVTATPAELNAIAGGGLSTAELAVLDGVTPGTSAASKAVVLGTNSKINALDITTLTLNGTALTVTAAEINALASTGLDATELGYLNAVTAGTVAASKAVVVSATKAIDTLLFTPAAPAAAGTTQGTSTAMTADVNLVTGANGAAGVVLPVAVVGRKIIVKNTVANANLLVYPASGAQINALGSNVAMTVPFGGMVEFLASSTTLWYASAPLSDAITATAAEINALAGTGLTAAELGTLNGVAATLTAAELNILDGVTATAAEINILAGVTAGTRAASKAVVLSSGSAIDQWDVAQTITSATPATTRLTRSELTLTPATSLAVGSSGSLVGVRGHVALTTDKEITDGFIYGVQGKFTGDGATISVGSGHIAGLYAQMSGSGMTVTDGHVAILGISGQYLPNTANIDAIYVESGGDQKAINSVMKTICNALLVFDLDYESAAGNVAMATTSTTTTNIGTSGWLKIKVHGTDRYIPLADAVT